MEHIFKKKYGQNFLQDQNILSKIYNSINPTPKDLIIEIGAGSGNLTKWLIKYEATLICFEIDKSLEAQLKTLESTKTSIIFEDFLTIDLKKTLSKYKYEKIYIIANIPYYITTPIIEKINEELPETNQMILMVQKEVADRLTARPKSKDYGYITVLLNYSYDIRKLFNVSKSCFYPTPKIDSAIISLNQKYKEKTDYVKLKSFLKSAFQYKRKNLKNNLKAYDLSKIEEILKQYNYSLLNRAEEIPIEIYIKIIQNL